MTALRARLGKMAPALTARQRFLAIFNAHRGGTAVDPELRASMPPEQGGEFYAYTRLLFASDVLLGNAAVTVHGHVGGLDRLVEHIAIMERNTAELERKHPELTRKPGERRRKGGRVTIPEWLRELAEQLRVTLVDEIRYRWHELRCIEVLWEDMATQLDGVDPAHPTVRAKLEEAREGLRRMSSTVPQGDELLTEPPEEKVKSLRTYVREAYALAAVVEGLAQRYFGDHTPLFQAEADGLVQATQAWDTLLAMYSDQLEQLPPKQRQALALTPEIARAGGPLLVSHDVEYLVAQAKAETLQLLGD